MAADWPPAELVQSLTYRETYTPADVPAAEPGRPLRSLTDHAPGPLRTAAGAGWALVSLVTAGAVGTVVVALLVRVLGVLA
jgi:hypothetical protein